MTSTTPVPAVNIQVGGSVTGQIVVGDHNVVLNADHGAVINVVHGEARPAPKARAPGSVARPRPPAGMLDRTAESAAATAALTAGHPVELHGESGVGKTTLLNYLANSLDASVFPDGIVCLSARRCDAEDVRQEVYEAFYETEVPFKPTDTVLRQSLNGKRALILLDDSALVREDAEALLDDAPASAIVFVSPDRRVWRGEVAARGVKGLPPDDALALATRELGRPLADGETAIVTAICAALQGHPLHIMQAMAAARDDGRALADVAKDAGVAAAPNAPAAPAAPATPAVGPATDAERRVIDALITVDAPMDLAAIRSIAQVPDAEAVLAALVARHLVLSANDHYRAAATAAAPPVVTNAG